MIPDDLPWGWIAAVLAAVALVIGGMRWRARRERRHRGYSRRVDALIDIGPAPEQRALQQAVDDLRRSVERQADRLTEVRTDVSRRYDELNGKLRDLARMQARRREGEPAGRDADGAGGYAASLDNGTWSADGGLPVAAEPAWSPGPGDQPVEVRDGVLVISRSLPPPGFVAAGAGGQARVYLNEAVSLSEFALPKWAVFFEMQGARPYAAYRTRRPAEVRWDAGQGRGELISKGLAEAI